VLLLHELSEVRNGLDGLAEPHLICQDPIHAAAMQGEHELHALQLVLPQ
jgi:hypothetical protein